MCCLLGTFRGLGVRLKFIIRGSWGSVGIGRRNLAGFRWLWVAAYWGMGSNSGSGARVCSMATEAICKLDGLGRTSRKSSTGWRTFRKASSKSISIQWFCGHINSQVGCGFFIFGGWLAIVWGSERWAVWPNWTENNLPTARWIREASWILLQ